ncbi:MAG: hypothetical protein ACLUES_15160 [Flavonifractor plautii]
MLRAFAAGCFTGIMQGTGMITEMASTLVSIIPNTRASSSPHRRHHRYARLPAL